MNSSIFQQRINYKGDIKSVLLRVCKDYSLGKYLSHNVILMGYEDFNLTMLTDKEKYFIKMFASFRDKKEILRYVETITKVLEAGVQHPKLLTSSQGCLYRITINNVQISLCVMKYIDGFSFYEKNLKTTFDEMRFLVQQAALINKINYKPKPIYDSWAIINFLDEYKKKKEFLNIADTILIDSLAKQFSAVKIDRLPHCFVHGDIIKTNVMKDNKGNLYIIDFSVSSYYPRVQELAVLICNMGFDENNPETFPKYYNLVLQEYRKNNSLTTKEIEILPLFVKVAYVMYVLSGIYEKKIKGNNSPENDYWIDLGKKGLRYTTSSFFIRTIG